MDSERWRQIQQVYDLALERDPALRNDFLAETCKDDLELRREVESLLAHSSPTNAVFDQITWDATGVLAPFEKILKPGERLGPYEIRGLLGKGGMGRVYLAVDRRLGRKVAVKISEEQFSGRFEREARAISALNHPNVCTLYDVGPNYLVTELVEGETLAAMLRQATVGERSLEIARQVLEALRAAHRAGIVHRDLKPANIMVRTDGYVKVLDFGVARRIPGGPSAPANRTTTGETLPGQIVGTVTYMSPEQILGQPVDQRSDLFSFGIVLYEMLTGRHPWRHGSDVETMRAILHEDPPSMDSTSTLGAELAPIVEKLLSKNPAERYLLAEAVLEALASRRPPAGSSLTTGKLLTSIAVLPFVFLSEVEERKALSLGFADALITMLGSLPDIAVLPTSAILNYAPGADPAHTCRDLGVRHVLQGNVQKVGTHWRVSIQLFDGLSQKNALSEKHDFVMENVFDVQDEIGRRVVGSLETRFTRALTKSRERYSSDPEAYNQFILGLAASYSDRAPILRSALEHLSRAVERDPDFALAHAMLSYVAMQINWEFDPQRVWLEKAESHCRRALALDPSLPEAHSARAFILWSPAKNFQHAEAIGELEQVLAAQPNNERAHNRMASICLHIGRLEEACKAQLQARRSNPKTRANNLEFFYLYSGDFVRAEQAAEAWIREKPESMYARWYHPYPPLMTGDLDLAEQRLAAGLKLYPDEPLLVTLLAMLHARRNQQGPALDCVRKALESPRSFGHTHHMHYQIACVYAVLGETDKAMGWLERSVETGNPCWPFFKVDPHLENLRQQAQFQRLVSDLEREYTALKIERL
jgi:serine/threonine protein kinase